MTLSSMVVSRDWQEVSVLECILGSLHVAVDVEPEPERARAKLAKSKIDALIVDSDLEGSAGFLRGLQNGAFPNAVALVIVGSSSDRKRLQMDRAAYIFQKPISVEQAVRTLSAARNMIMDGRLRYHRQALEIPASLTCGRKKRLKGHLLNLSQGGAGIQLQRSLPASGPVRVSFSLPGAKVAVRVQGEIVWCDQRGKAGIRFVEISSRLKRSLQLWLEKQYLTH